MKPETSVGSNTPGKNSGKLLVQADEILPGLYLGPAWLDGTCITGPRQIEDEEFHQRFGFTHVLSLCRWKPLSKFTGPPLNQTQDIFPVFSQAIDFIHKARMAGGK